MKRRFWSVTIFIFFHLRFLAYNFFARSCHRLRWKIAPISFKVCTEIFKIRQISNFPVCHLYFYDLLTASEKTQIKPPSIRFQLILLKSYLFRAILLFWRLNPKRSKMDFTLLLYLKITFFPLTEACLILNYFNLDTACLRFTYTCWFLLRLFLDHFIFTTAKYGLCSVSLCRTRKSVFFFYF